MTSWGSLVAAVGRANLSQNEALERRRAAQKINGVTRCKGATGQPCRGHLRKGYFPVNGLIYKTETDPQT